MKNNIWISSEFEKPNSSYKSITKETQLAKWLKANQNHHVGEISINKCGMFNESEIIEMIMKYNVTAFVIYFRGTMNYQPLIKQIKEKYPNIKVRTQAYGRKYD